jgi:hypothetical protein
MRLMGMRWVEIVVDISGWMWYSGIMAALR